MSKHRERALEKYETVCENSLEENKTWEETKKEVEQIFDNALSEQRGEIIDEVVKIANENRNYKWSFDEFIQEIEGLREVK
jgi:hypothetical protein